MTNESDLWDKLNAVRLKLAKDYGMAGNRLISDESMLGLLALTPVNRDGFSQAVREKNRLHIADYFLEVIREFKESFNKPSTDLIFSHVDPAAPVGPPTRQHEADTGYDIYVSGDYTIPPNQSAVIGHNLRVQLPPNTWGMVTGRSSNVDRGLQTLLGILDNGYRGPVTISVFNFSGEECVIPHGDRIAQLILLPMVVPPVQYADRLDDSDRGNGSLGSTGK